MWRIEKSRKKSEGGMRFNYKEPERSLQVYALIIKVITSK